MIREFVGQGYWVLVWDAFGAGLNLVNPRLLEQGGRNWWPCPNTLSEEGRAHVAISERGLP